MSHHYRPGIAEYAVRIWQSVVCWARWMILKPVSFPVNTVPTIQVGYGGDVPQTEKKTNKTCIQLNIPVRVILAIPEILQDRLSPRNTNLIQIAIGFCQSTVYFINMRSEVQKISPSEYHLSQGAQYCEIFSLWLMRKRTFVCVWVVWITFVISGAFVFFQHLSMVKRVANRI